MFNATGKKTRLWLLILVGIVTALTGQTHARQFFAPCQPASGVFAAHTQATTGQNYDACRYDAPDSLLGSKASPFGPTVPVPVSGSVKPIPDMSNLRDINNFIAIWPALRLPPSHSGQKLSPGSISSGDMFVFELEAYNMPLPQLNAIGDNPKVDPRIRKSARKISQSISVSNHDYEILSDTVFGFSLMFFGEEEVGADVVEAGIEAGIEAGAGRGITSVVRGSELLTESAGETTVVLREGQYINRVWDSRWTEGSIYSGPRGGSYSPDGALPIDASTAIESRGLGIPNVFNNAERGGIYEVTSDIPAIFRTSIDGTEPELFIQPQYRQYLNLIDESISTIPSGK